MPARTAPQLIVDAPALMALGTDDVETTGGKGFLLVRGNLRSNLSYAPLPLCLIELTVQLVASAFPYETINSFGVLNVSSMTLSLPTATGVTATL